MITNNNVIFSDMINTTFIYIVVCEASKGNLSYEFDMMKTGL